MTKLYKKMNHWITKEEEELMNSILDFSNHSGRGELIRSMLRDRAEMLQLPIPEGFKVVVPRAKSTRKTKEEIRAEIRAEVEAEIAAKKS